MFHLAEMVDEKSAELPADQRPDAQRQKREPHVRPLLSRRRKPGNVFVVARRLGDLAESHRDQREDHARHGRPQDQDDPRQRQ